jgi:XTP/dITP diphosphohydrolase
LRLLIATTNVGKIVEFREMLGDARFEYTDLSQHPRIEAPEETGDTFEANAQLKASFYAKHFGAMTLADDSGLEVDALGGKPGVHSARWAAMHDAGQGDADNNVLLLKQLREVPAEKPKARFVCALALADARGEILTTVRGTVDGTILLEPRGDHGFGYDPLFLVPSIGKTTAELTPAQKHGISHRGNALRLMRQEIERAGLVGS